MSKFAQLNYYEELGIDPGASAEDVRDAFRHLVRLLHPDHQTDPQMKAIAELQMRKLNRVYAILSDPERRRRYDDFLEEDPRPTIVVNPASTIDIRRLAMRAAWVASTLVTIGMLIWFSSGETPPQPPPKEDKTYTISETLSPAGASAVALPEELARLRASLRTTRAQRDSAMAEVNRLLAHQSADRKTLQFGIPEPLETSATQLPKTAAEPPASRPETSARAIDVPSKARFVGTWAYVRPRNSGDKVGDLYTPEFIEATIRQNGDRLTGQYRSRYRVLDRAISPDVYFQFDGPVGASTVVVPWTGRGGAKGELTMHLTDKNLLQIDWEASELGTVQGLVSGSATLARRAEPAPDPPATSVP